MNIKIHEQSWKSENRVHIVRKSMNTNRLTSDQQSIKHPSKDHYHSIRNPPNINQKSIKIDAWRESGRILAPKHVLGGVWVASSDFGSQADPNLGFKKDPSSSPNHTRIDVKLYQIVEAFLNRHLWKESCEIR